MLDCIPFGAWLFSLFAGTTSRRLAVSFGALALAVSHPLAAQTVEPQAGPKTLIVSRAFHDAPMPRFKSLRLATTASDNSISETMEVGLVESDGIVTLVTERSRADIRDGGSDKSTQTIESRSRYILGGLVFLAGEWTEVQNAEDGTDLAQQEGSATEGFSRVSGRLFPLAVGNSLDLEYSGRVRDRPDPVRSRMSYRVLRTIPADSVHKRLTGQLFVILNTYTEEIDGEVYSGEEEILYAPALGWPVRYRQTEKDSGVTIETRLVDFAFGGDD